MSTEFHYANSPLTEAIIDIRVQLSDGLKIESLLAVQESQKELYPKQDSRLFFEAELSSDLDAPPVSATRTHIGYVFASEDGLQSFQVRLDGFTFSRLKPYDKWSTFRDEARRLWGVYRDIVNPLDVTRLAVRYINRLDINQASIDLKDYLRTSPEVSPALPQVLAGYFMQLQIPQPDHPWKAIINQALIPPPSLNITSILLDIDLFQDVDLPDDEEGIWSIFELFRHRKNEIFLGCISDTMEGIIKNGQ